MPTVTAEMNNYLFIIESISWKVRILNVFTKNFNYLKKKNNLTYRDIRSFLKCGTETINIVSNGDQNNVRIEIVVKLAELLNVSLDELVKIDLENLEKNT